MDIEDRGPQLDAGNFAMRVTNVGVIGNAFFNVGLSFDPSFEYPRGSGHEALGHAELWVGALTGDGHRRVSGGPMLEFRPTLDENDRVRVGWMGQRGSRRGVDEDGDGKFDEEEFNLRDDDGDGEIDEDMGFPSQKVLACEYVDDRPEAVNYGYEGGEHHEPLGLSVRQEAYAWSAPNFDNIAGFHFTITNHGTQELRDVYLGIYADLDSRGRQQPGGYLDDVIEWRDYSVTTYDGRSSIYSGFDDPDKQFIKYCYSTHGGRAPLLRDRSETSGMPASAIIPISHTTDPLALLKNDAFFGVRAARESARAPARDTSFHFAIFAQDLPPGQGGPPTLDADRYAAFQGKYRTMSRSDVPHDYAVLLSCGPFPRLPAGESVSFDVALIASSSPDSLYNTMLNAAYIGRGVDLNLMRDSVAANGHRDLYDIGETGVNGHEICLEPPAGIEFDYDPHCPDKLFQDPAYIPIPNPVFGTVPRQIRYRHGYCVWTDVDCDACTGLNGGDTHRAWLNPGSAPPTPSFRVVRGDHEARIEWDNLPEILVDANVVIAEGFHFTGYRLYRLSDWNRESILPPPTSWQLIGAFGRDTLNREVPLETIRDTTVDYDYIRYGQRHYPIGRYAVEDRHVLNGFDYLYAVTAVAERPVQVGSVTRYERLESPLVASIDSVTVPHAAARSDAGSVRVVPNPYRAHAPWDRPPVPGDPFGRHIDFLGLPRSRSTIRIYTVAGDFVAQIDHDGSGGDGQASWNLISRNGQDVESGIYLFTVESTLGHSVGRFVVIR